MAEIQQEEGEEPVEYFDVRSTGDDAVPEPTGAESFPPHLLTEALFYFINTQSYRTS